MYFIYASNREEVRVVYFLSLVCRAMVLLIGGLHRGVGLDSQAGSSSNLFCGYADSKFIWPPKILERDE